MKQIVFIIFVVIIGVSLFETLRLAWRISKGVRIAEKSIPFQTVSPDSDARVLIIGDSTGVGTGSSRPEDSIAGRLASDFPFIEIVNLSVNGAEIGEIEKQLQCSAADTFDVVLVQVGGNDILRFTPLTRVRSDMTAVLTRAGKKGREVIFMSTGNVGLAPAFFPPLSWIYTRRTRAVRAIFIKIAAREGIQYVDLFKEREEDPFIRDPKRFYAPDFLHPSGEGYRLWYEELMKQTSITSILDERMRIEHDNVGI